MEKTVDKKVIALIVTYGDRLKLLEKVLQGVDASGVKHVVVVENASKITIKNDVQRFPAKIDVIRLDSNFGSAIGIAEGIKYLQESKTSFDFLWILDDDNVPESHALTNIYLSYRQLRPILPFDDVVLYSYRGKNRLSDFRLVNGDGIKKYFPNNFAGHNLKRFVKEKLILRPSSTMTYSQLLTRVYHGPYGGLFMSFDSLQKIGLPNKDYYLYADDHEFTYRFNDLNIAQYIVFASQIDDIDQSFDENGILGINSNASKVYYSLRNHVNLSQKFRQHEFKYKMNKYSSMLLIFLKLVWLNFPKLRFIMERAKLICKAISDGESSRLGEIESLSDTYSRRS